MKSVGGLLRAAVATVLLMGLAGASLAQVSEAEIDEAIAAGVENVFANQQPDGRWGQFDWAGGHHYPWGRDAIALLTLEFADVPLDDERYQKGLKIFLEADLEFTYEWSCRTMTLAHLTRRTKGDKQAGFRTALHRNVKWLEQAQGEHGGWTYVTLNNGPGRHDFSNSQMAVLALSEAIMSGIEVSPKVMARAQDIFLKAQRGDGGWNYQLGSTREESYGSMTAAAVATLFITRDYLTPQVGCPCQGGRSPRRQSATDKAIEAGTQWLAENYEVARNPKYSMDAWSDYWHYSVARVGVATGFKYLGEHNWYQEGAAREVQRTRFGGQNFPFSCLATLFLIKGKAPLLASKLQWQGEWNLHPRDLANLTLYLSKVKEQPIGWQIVPVDAPVEEWHDAPILYISAEDKIDLSDEQKQRLRQFAVTGGTLFFEASCGNRTADAWWRNLCKELWPDFEFQRVDDDHPLWTADARIVGRKPLLLGLSDGLRTFVFLAPRDISCSWNTTGTSRNQANFEVGGNLYMYATDKSPLRSRLADKPPLPEYYSSAMITCGPKANLTAARLKTGGDYYVGAMYEPFKRYNEQRSATGPQVTVADPVEAGEARLKDVDILWLTGRQSAELSDQAAKAVRAYLEGGGFLLAEAAMGDERFAESFAKTAKALGLTLKAQAEDASLIAGRLQGASGYDVAKVRFSAHLKIRRIGSSGPALEGLYLGDRLVGVWSPYDVTFSQTGCKAFGNLGYHPDDARAILTNILLLATARQGGEQP